MVDIIKQDGKRPTETFDRAKLHSSVQAACLSVRTPEGVAEGIANRVCDNVVAWLESKFEVTSHDIRRMAAHFLETFHPDAAYLYQHHRLLI